MSAPSLLSRLSPAATPDPLSTSPTNPATHDAPHPSRRVRGTRGHGKHPPHDSAEPHANPTSADTPTAPLAMRQAAAASSVFGSPAAGGVGSPPPLATGRGSVSPRKPAPMHLQPLLASLVKVAGAKADIYASRWATDEVAAGPAKVAVPVTKAAVQTAAAGPAPVSQLTSMMEGLKTQAAPIRSAPQANGTRAPTDAAAPTTSQPPAPAATPALPKPAAPVAKPAAASPSKPILGGRSRWALDTDEVPDVPEAMQAVANGVSRHAPPAVQAAPKAALPAAPAAAPVEKSVASPPPAPTPAPAAHAPAPAPKQATPPPEPTPPTPSTPPSATPATLNPPPTPSSFSINPDHIDWAEDDDDALPTLDDWGISADAPPIAEVEAPAPAAPKPAPANAWGVPASAGSSSAPASKSPRLGGPAPVPSQNHAGNNALGSSTRGRGGAGAGGRGGGRGGVASNRAMGVAISAALAHNQRIGPNINPPLPGAKKAAAASAAKGGKHGAAAAAAGGGALAQSQSGPGALAKAPPPHLAGAADGGAAGRGAKALPPPGVFERLSGLGPKPARGGRGGAGLGRGAGSGAVERGW